ncbi:phospholipid-binding protein MlaC [Motiliproteus sp. SC1-56]|uniref:MlaC/ttg2D family ABC transporter substrate-binding protein n=1 Tax=Motiliproteus sp. SC1-56 TaxID=2799565 RepID=UPI001A8D4B08|nr:ABC transporter substrate-binding protein [Motiliproteus sp. SC1-56]
MNVLNAVRTSILGFLLLALVPAQANETPRGVIEGRYNSLLQLIEEQVLVAGMPQEELLGLMERELVPVVDFPRVARKVMGKYARRASEAQLGNFTEIFKTTLVSTYSKGLNQLDQLDHVVIEDPILDSDGSRAKVPTEVVLTGGERYKVIYSMFESDGRWLIENIVVEGVNIGLVFKNQFAHYMENYNRDIDQVIAHWGD